MVPRSVPACGAESPPTAASIRSELTAALATLPGIHGRRCAGGLSMAYCDVLQGRPEETAAEHAAGACRAAWRADTTDGDEHWYTLQASRPAAEQLCEDLLRTKLSCRAVDAATHSLSRAVAWGAPEDASQTFGLVEWGYAAVTYCSVRGGRPVYARQFKGLGLHVLEEQACGELGVDRHAFDQLMNSRDADSRAGLQELLRDLAEPLAARLGGELERTLTHLRSHRRPAVPRRVHLFGGGALLGFEGRLSERAGCPVAPWKLSAAGPGIDTPHCLLGPAIALSA
ncbi:MAG: hypothetical protein AAF790_15005, partial [Planctomycetota bacterium]